MTRNQIRLIKCVLDSEQFYEKMQAYRIAPAWNQHETTKAFEEVKKYILDVLTDEENNED